MFVVAAVGGVHSTAFTSLYRNVDIDIVINYTQHRTIYNWIIKYNYKELKLIDNKGY